MSASLDRPAPVYGQPPADSNMPSLSEAVDTIIMILQYDQTHPNSDDIRGELGRLMSAMQQKGMQVTGQQQGQQQGNPMTDQTESFGAGDDQQAAQNSGLLPGTQYAGSGY